MTSVLSLYPFSVLLVLVQAVAAVPWLVVLNLDNLRSRKQPPNLATWLRWLGMGLVGVLVGGAVVSGLFTLGQAHESLELYGKLYGLALHIQLTVDAFIVALGALLALWPKGAAVALAAFREGWRQPMFWLLMVLGLVLMGVTPWLPYFTFGEDYKMVKELGYDIIMLAAVIFGVLAASMSISEEIEGRTAVTLMSKPVSRRQFLIGKFFGILLAAGVMAAVLTFAFDGILLHRIDRDNAPIPAGLDDYTTTWVGQYGDVPGYFLRGIGYWLGHVFELSPGAVLAFCHVMVLIAIAVALATRLPMIVNLMICLVFFILGHLAPVLQQASQNRFALVRFMAEMSYYVLPGLDLFNLGPLIVKDTAPPLAAFAGYIGLVSVYALLYTTIALLLGLILFEDRDLA